MVLQPLCLGHLACFWVVMPDFLVQSAVPTSRSSSHVHNALGELKSSLRSLDDWWDDRWRLVAWVRAFGPLAEAIKLCLDLGKGGKRCLMIDPAFSDIAHTTMQPRSVDNKDKALKIFLNYRTHHSQNGAGKLHFLPLTILFNLYWIWGCTTTGFMYLILLRDFIPII